MLVVERNRLYPAHPQNRKSIAIINTLEYQLALIEEDMNYHILNHFKEFAGRWSSIKDVGPHDYCSTAD